MKTINGKYKVLYSSFSDRKAGQEEYQTIRDNQETLRAKAGTGKLRRLKDSLIEVLEMTLAYLKGEYRDIPLGTLSEKE